MHSADVVLDAVQIAGLSDQSIAAMKHGQKPPRA